jgi:hypothetical protein
MAERCCICGSNIDTAANVEAYAGWCSSCDDRYHQAAENEGERDVAEWAAAVCATESAHTGCRVAINRLESSERKQLMQKLDRIIWLLGQIADGARPQTHQAMSQQAAEQWEQREVHDRNTPRCRTTRDGARCYLDYGHSGDCSFEVEPCERVARRTCRGKGSVEASTVERCTTCGRELIAGKGKCIACVLETEKAR